MVSGDGAASGFPLSEYGDGRPSRLGRTRGQCYRYSTRPGPTRIGLRESEGVGLGLSANPSPETAEEKDCDAEDTVDTLKESQQKERRTRGQNTSVREPLLREREDTRAAAIYPLLQATRKYTGFGER